MFNFALFKINQTFMEYTKSISLITERVHGKI